MRDLRWAVAGFIVGTALLAGCSAKVEANDTLPSTSAAETTEAFPPMGPADFPVPAKARTKDAAGAEAFLHYWVDLLNRQQSIPAGQPLRDLGPDCEECRRIAKVFDQAAAAGHRYEGGEMTLKDVTPPRIDGDTATMSFGVAQEAVSIVDSNGTVVDPGFPADANIISGVGLKFSTSSRGWLVQGFNLGA